MLGRTTIGVDLGATLNLVGAIVKYLSLTSLVGAGLALGYDEPLLPFAVAGVAAAVGGWLLERLTTGKERVGVREGFLVVALSWLLAAGFFATPYLIADEPQFGRFIDAYFEAMSGMTTTGASVLTDVEALYALAAHVASVLAVDRRAWASSCSLSRSCRGCASAAGSSSSPSFPGPRSRS